MRRLTVFALLIAGCAGGGSDPEDKFVGTWADIGTVSGVCSDGSTVPATSTTGQIVITKGTTTDLLRASTTAMPCPIPLNISGNHATLGGAATCTKADGNTISVSAWTLDVDGDNGNETGSGTIAVPNGGGSCTFTATGTLTR